LLNGAMADGTDVKGIPVVADMRHRAPHRPQRTRHWPSAAILRASSAPVLLVDRNGILLENNEPARTFLTLLGCRVGEKLPNHITQLIPGVLLSGQSERASIQCMDRKLALTVACGQDPRAGPPARSRSSNPLLVLVDDRDSEASVLRSLSFAFYTSRPNRLQGETWMSPGVEELTGYPPSNFTSNAGFWISRVHPKDRPGVIGELARPSEGGKTTLQYRFLCADGSYRWFLDQIVFAQGSTKGHGIMQDIDRQKTSELATREHDEFLEAMMESATHGTILLDDDNCLAFMSPQLAKMLGFNASDWVTKRTRMFFHPEDEQAGLEAISSALRGVPGSCRARLKGANGTCIHVQLYISSMVWHGRRMVLCMAGDMSDQVRAETERTECIREGVDDLVCAALAALAPGISRKEAMDRIRPHLGVKGHALLETFGGEDK